MVSLQAPIVRARSLLFVPGHRPERFEKAAMSGADGIVLDIEDAVGPEVKPTARQNIRRWLLGGGTGIVRINSEDTPWYEDDVEALSDISCAVLLPKVIAPEQITRLQQGLTADSCVLPLIETASGVLRAQEICAVPGVVRAVFGNADLGRELGIDHADIYALTYARSVVVFASAASELPPPVDGVTTALADEKKLVIDAEHAASLGFTGKLCLHPRQVAVVNETFTPSAEDLEWARGVITAVNGSSVAAKDGHVVGKPIVERAQRLLSRAEGFMS
ncbi:CoA ester lyase [Amycolatopsis sp. GM8]|uniref:HpcH/HpaI aldolase/citrate lyase family protein n=1 Tax=Amycolatopsis sp. GM8 TaxID=2896530 RepID=UPI001F2AA343|nr:CoA ester lyase [Amycolatopsis sp. GM8]